MTDGKAIPTSHRVGIVIHVVDPHSPWQRGTNENTYGLLWQYFPKGINFENITDNDSERSLNYLCNNSPHWHVELSRRK